MKRYQNSFALTAFFISKSLVSKVLQKNLFRLILFYCFCGVFLSELNSIVPLKFSDLNLNPGKNQDVRKKIMFKFLGLTFPT